MPKIEYIVNPVGGLDKNNNPLAVSDKDFVDAVDITSINPNEVNSDQNLKLYNNIDFAFDIGEVTKQIKRYKVSIDYTNISSGGQNIFFAPSKDSAWVREDYAVEVTILSSLTPSAIYTSAVNEFFASTVWSNALLSNPTFGNKFLSFEIEFPINTGFDDYKLNYTDWQLQTYFDANAGSVATIEVLQDAISAEKEGKLIPIGFCNVGEYVFVFSTTGNKKEVVTKNITLYNNGGIYSIYPSFNVNYIPDEELNVKCFPFAQLTSNWATKDDYFEGALTPPMNNVLGLIESADITQYSRTASAIGVAYKNKNTGVWDYKQLLLSTNLNFRTYKQIEGNVSVFDDGVIFDFTDNLNNIKRLIYKGEYIENGFLTVYNPKALYDLDNIVTESNLQQPVNTAKVTIQTADRWTYGQSGAKPEGSYAYFVRFITADGLQTTWSEPSNVAWTHSYNIETHQAGNSTEMSIRVTLEQVPFKEFTHYQIGFAQFNSNSWSMNMLPMAEINSRETIVTFDTGFNAEQYLTFGGYVEDLPLVFEKVKCLLDYDNYVVAANVKLPAPYDLREWAQTFTFTEAIGTFSINQDYIQNQNRNWHWQGINNPLYCSNNYMGYMPHEETLFYVKVYWNNNAPPSWFFCKRKTHTNEEITDNGNPTINLNYNYWEVTDIDFNYILPTGELVRDVVKDIRFGRTAIAPSVFATGIGISALNLDDEPFPLYSYLTESPYDAIRGDRLVIHSPDLINNGTTLTPKTGDYIRATEVDVAQNIYPLPTLIEDWGLDYFGNDANGFQQKTIDAAQDLHVAQVGNYINLFNSYDDLYHQGCLSIKLTSALTPTGSVYFWNTYYVRPYEGNEAYPLGVDSYTAFLIPQDKWYDKDTHTTSTIYNLYGGNTFTQKQYYKTDSDAITGLGSVKGQILGFYSFNKSNGSLRSGKFPYYLIQDYMQDVSFNDDAYTYDNCFTPKYPFKSGKEITDLELQANRNNPNSIFWSEKHLANALQGNNRIWNIGDQRAIETNWGVINAFAIINTKLIVLQDRKITSQYFNNSGKLITEDSEALLGTGAVMGIKGVDLSQFGTSHKWSVIKGKAVNGSDTLYWFSYYGLKLMRYAADGLTPISDMANMSSFLQNYVDLFDIAPYNYDDAPADGNGITGGWNQEKYEAIWTFRGIRKHTTYSDATTYAKGDWVIAETPTYFGFENVPVLYRSKLVANADNPLSDTAWWEKFDYYNTESMLYYTIVWNEKENKLKCFLSFLPKIYGAYQNSMVSGHPTESNLIYEHNQNNQARYYCSVPELGGNNGFSIVKTSENITIASIADADDIATWFGVSSFPYYTTTELGNHTSYYIFVQGIYARITSFLSAYAVTVDVNEPLTIDPAGQFEQELYYSTCNTGQPLIKQVLNKSYPRYMNYGSVTMNINKRPQEVHHKGMINSDEQKSTETFNLKNDFANWQGRIKADIPMDITNGNEREKGFQGVEGYYLEETIKFTPNIKNSLQDYSVIMVEQNKKIK